MRDKPIFATTIDDHFTKQEKKDKNAQYCIGYFNWYWAKYGIFKTSWDFFGRSLLPEVIKTTFYNFGLGIGAFIMRKFVLKEFSTYI